MDDVLRMILGTFWLLLVFGVVSAATTCLSVAGLAIWPDRCERVRELLEESPGRCLFLGLVNLLALLLAAAIFKGPVAFCLVCLLLLLLVLGLPAAFALVGERVRLLGMLETTNLSSAVTGTMVVLFAGLLPLAGQALLVAGLVMTFGASLRVFLSRSQAAPLSAPTEPLKSRLREELEI